MELQSQKMRKLAPELDPLRIGTGMEDGGSFKTSDIC